MHTHGIIGRHEVEAEHMPEELRDAPEYFARVAEEQRPQSWLDGGE